MPPEITTKEASYGSWTSPITSELIVRGAVGLSQPAIDGVLLANTIPQTPEFVAALADRLTILDVSTIFAQALNGTDLANHRCPPGRAER